MKNLLIIVAYIFSCSVYAQPNTNLLKTPQSPDVSGFEQRLEVPVNYATGVPSVTIPITTISQDNISLPVSLDYHMGGVVVGQPSTWVGQNWNLNAGGMISVIKNGLKDDTPGGYLTSYHNVYDSLNGTSFLDSPSLSSQWQNGTLDADPDMYNYSFLGYSGKFMIEPSASKRILQFPKTDLIISVEWTSNVIQGFTIITMDGTKYFFGQTPGGSQNAKERNANMVPLEVTAFYLVKIESANGLHWIDLNYVSNNYTFRAPGTEIAYSDGCGGMDYICDGGCFQETEVQSKVLSSITNSSNTNTVTFSGSPLPRTDLLLNPKSLGQISISNGPECKEFNFFYDYFQDNSSTFLGSKRLKLDSIREESCDATIIKPPYKFEYVGPEFSGKQFIAKTDSRRIDHWGYYNGASQNDLATINAPSGGFFTGGNREADATFVKYGSLNKITFPTGGYHLYDMEVNSSLFKEYQDDETLIYLRNCIPTNPSACCNDVVMMDNITFTSQDQIEVAEYTLSIDLEQSVCNACSSIGNASDIEVEMWRGNVLVGTTSINTSNTCMSHEDATFPLSSLFSAGGLNQNENIFPDTLYTFIVTSGKGIGEFTLKTKKLVNIDRKVGGLRAKTITIHDGISTANDIVKHYTYPHATIGGVSSGIIKWIPKYHYFTWFWPGDFLDAMYIQSRPNVEYIISQPRLPNSALRSGHITYEHIVERIIGNGRTEMDFFTGFEITNLDLELPGQLDEIEERLQNKRIYDESNNLIQEENYIPAGSGAQSEDYDFFIARRLASPQQCMFPTGQYWPVPYSVETHAKYRLFSKTTTIDGVSTTETNYYDPLGRIYQPIATEMTNSDGKLHRQEVDFPFTIAASPQGAELLDRNIKTPIETRRLVGGIKVDGTKTTHQLIGGFPYVDSIYAYKVTWDGNTLIDEGWDFEQKVLTYDLAVGKPKTIKVRDWNGITLDWNTSTALLEKKTYLTHISQYEYQGNGFLSRSIDVDGQIVDMTYDQLGRTKNILSRPKVSNPNPLITSNYNVIREIDYHYQNATDPFNHTTSSTSFTPTTGSLYLDQSSKEVVDGIGRSIQSILIDHSPNHKDVVEGNLYDNVGRNFDKYIPVESGSTGGIIIPIPPSTAKTTSSYEESPLNRINDITPPEWFATSNTYGTNDMSDAVNGYPVGELRKTVITDPDGKSKITFTDKLGRSVLIRITDGVDVNDTYTFYDDKDRVIKVIPPGSTDNDSTLNFYYEYDVNNNVIYEDMPDKEAVEYLYDYRKQQVASRTPNLKNQGLWLVTEYDDHGRQNKTGFHVGAINDVENISIDSLLSEYFYDGFDGTSTLGDQIYKGRIRKERTNIMTTGGHVGSSFAEKLYEYDDFGRLSQQSNLHHLNGTDVFNYGYDFADNVVTSNHAHTSDGSTTNILWSNMYDHQGREVQKSVQIGLNPPQILCELDYTYRDEVSERNIGKLTGIGGRDFLQSIDYLYNAQSWLTQINAPQTMLSGLDPCDTGGNESLIGTQSLLAGDDDFDLFYEKLNYQTNVGGFTQNKNGNISSTQWQFKNRTINYHGYQYDFLNRLITDKHLQDYGQGIVDAITNNSTNYEYDDRGNFTKLNRHGSIMPDCDAPKTIDSLQYVYYDKTNQIKQVNEMLPCPTDITLPAEIHRDMVFGAINKIKVENTIVYDGASIDLHAGNEIEILEELIIKGTQGIDVVSDVGPCVSGNFYSSGFNQFSPTGLYLYDENGNMTFDPNKNMQIFYNYLNLPVRFVQDDTELQITYDANGLKLSKERFVGNQKVDSTYYVNGLEHRGELLDVYHEDGIVTKNIDNSVDYQYYLKDHLGNVRFFFKDTTGDGIVNSNEMEQHHYYPFGMEVEGTWMETGEQNQYLYSGNEHNDFTGLSDFNFRWLDHTIGRFIGADLASKMEPSWNSYRLSFDNPIKFTDKLGLMEEEYTAEQGYERLRKVKEMTYEAAGNDDCCAGTEMKFEYQISNKEALADGRDPKQAWADYKEDTGANAIGEAALFAVKEAAIFYVGGRAVQLLFRGGKWVVVAVKASRKAKQGITILGKYPQYIELANKLNARRFSIPTKIWNKMTASEQWAANVKFLDRTILKGDMIKLSNPVKNINAVGGYFRRELDYLINKGYRLNKSGTQLIK